MTARAAVPPWVAAAILTNCPSLAARLATTSKAPGKSASAVVLRHAATLLAERLGACSPRGLRWCSLIVYLHAWHASQSRSAYSPQHGLPIVHRAGFACTMRPHLLHTLPSVCRCMPSHPHRVLAHCPTSTVAASVLKWQMSSSSRHGMPASAISMWKARLCRFPLARPIPITRPASSRSPLISRAVGGSL